MAEYPLAGEFAARRLILRRVLFPVDHMSTG